MNKMGTVGTSRIWMNVTTSVNWNRPAVGIVRVEQELFKALSILLGDSLRPCVLSNGKFVRYRGAIGHAAPNHATAAADGWFSPIPLMIFPARRRSI